MRDENEVGKLVNLFFERNFLNELCEESKQMKQNGKQGKRILSGKEIEQWVVGTGPPSPKSKKKETGSQKKARREKNKTCYLQSVWGEKYIDIASSQQTYDGRQLVDPPGGLTFTARNRNPEEPRDMRKVHYVYRLFEVKTAKDGSFLTNDTPPGDTCCGIQVYYILVRFDINDKDSNYLVCVVRGNFISPKSCDEIRDNIDVEKRDKVKSRLWDKYIDNSCSELDFKPGATNNHKKDYDNFIKELDEHAALFRTHYHTITVSKILQRFDKLSKLPRYSFISDQKCANLQTLTTSDHGFFLQIPEKMDLNATMELCKNQEKAIAMAKKKVTGTNKKSYKPDPITKVWYDAEGYFVSWTSGSAEVPRIFV